MEIVSDRQWAEALEELRVEEKRATRAADALAAKRRRLPAVAVEKPYRFQGPDGSEIFGLSVFVTEGGRVLRTYFTDGRGVEALGSVWTFLDRTPLGRQEQWEDSPPGVPQSAPFTWWRRHDEYDEELS